MATTGPATAPQSSAGDEIPRLIAALSDPDSGAREKASQQLQSIGAAARPALVKAIRGNNPEQRSRAASVLLKLPWHAPDDPPQVRRSLETYGRMDEEKRKAVVTQELFRRHRAVDVLLRLLIEEPSESVRWQIVSLLARHDDEPFLRKLRALDVSADDPPVLRLVAQAWFYLDKAKSLDLCRRALEADARNPSSDAAQPTEGSSQRQLDFCSEQLIADAIARKQFDEAAQWVRRQIPREPADERYALARLIALHVYFGPLKGLDDDVRTWGTNADAVKQIIEYVAQRNAKPGGQAPTLPQDVLFAAVNLSAEERLIGGAFFLFEHKLYEQAEQETKAAMAMPVAQEQLRLQRDVRASILLGLIYGAQERDELAADALQQAVTGADGSLWRPSDDLWAEIHWRRARASEAKKDKPAADKHVQLLVQYTPTATDNAIEIVNWLKSAGRVKEGRDMFERTYANARAVIDETPGADATPMNDLAWLCARCDERLADAVELAKKAVAAEPENAAFLDTLAEAQFRSGNPEEAVKLESKALEYRPNDEFMQKQLVRFKAGKP